MESEKSSVSPSGVDASSLSGPSPNTVSSQTPVPVQSQGRNRVSIRSTAQKSLSRRRYMPYGRTPGSRRIGAIERDFPRTPTEEENPPCFTGLVGVSWRVYKITPLYHFKTTESHLKKYGRLLAAFMEAERRKGQAVDVEEQTADRVHLSHYPGLQLTQDDPLAIQVLMRGRDKYGNGELRTVLTAYLLGVEIEEGLKPGIQKDMAHYPVMLVKGALGLTRLMADWFKLQFDCSVSPLLFSALDLTWISAMWSGKLTGGSTKPVELVYKLPPGCEGLNKITLTINPEDCKEIWDCIHDERYQDVTREEVSAYITSLENHFYHLFRIKLGAMQLNRVGTSVAYVGAEGKVKLFSEDNVLLILRHVTCLALEQLGNFG